MLMGFSSSICKLRLTVGCCENIMANKSSPHAPVVSMRLVSNTHIIRLRRYSTMAIISVSIERMLKVTNGENTSSMLMFVCWILCCFVVGSKSQNELLTRLRFVPSADMMCARSKSAHRRSGRNCCCSNVVL